MFADISADVYVMADGDSIYDAATSPELIERLTNENLDMVVGTRRDVFENAHRAAHGLLHILGPRIGGPPFALKYD
jgi:hypothetical protein